MTDPKKHDAFAGIPEEVEEYISSLERQKAYLESDRAAQDLVNLLSCELKQERRYVSRFGEWWKSDKADLDSIAEELGRRLEAPGERDLIYSILSLGTLWVNRNSVQASRAITKTLKERFGPQYSKTSNSRKAAATIGASMPNKVLVTQLRHLESELGGNLPYLYLAALEETCQRLEELADTSTDEDALPNNRYSVEIDVEGFQLFYDGHIINPYDVFATRQEAVERAWHRQIRMEAATERHALLSTATQELEEVAPADLPSAAYSVRVFSEASVRFPLYEAQLNGEALSSQWHLSEQEAVQEAINHYKATRDETDHQG